MGANATKASAIEAKRFFMSHLLLKISPRIWGRVVAAFLRRHRQQFAGKVRLVTAAHYDYARGLFAHVATSRVAGAVLATQRVLYDSIELALAAHRPSVR
jgi:hypothetical protein